LSATFAAALLLLLPAVEGRPAHLSAAAALLGFSVLAKGLVPLVLLLPFFWFARKHWRQWLRPVPLLVFAAVTLPWYVLCEMRNPRFLQVFFWQHQFGRFASAELQHVQPFWFYVPVLLGAMFPSTLLAGFAFAPRIYRDRACRFLAALVIFGFVFFSAATNKLPGYLLPLLPFVCLLAACGLDAARHTWPKPMAALMVFSAMLTPLFLLAGGLLPAALAGGLRDAFPVDLTTAGRMAAAVPVAIVAAGVMIFPTRERALSIWFGLAFLGWFYVEYAALPWVDRTASARSLWLEIPEPKRAYCVGPVRRDWRYGLNYYAAVPLPDCAPGATVNEILPGKTAWARPVIR
jgi:4-amino-4-deoxy-L-arabinose transferase-like glycosyltransferase